MSSDILTQLQTLYAQLLTQFYSTISYLSQRHPILEPSGDPSNIWTLPSTLNEAPPYIRLKEEDTDYDSIQNPRPLKPDSPDAFERAQRDLAEDLVRKVKQIEWVISKLPGIERTESQQEEKIRELAEEVNEVDRGKRAKRKEMRKLVERLDAVVMGMANSIPEPAAHDGKTPEINDVNSHR